MRKVTDQYVFAFLLMIEMGVGNSKEKMSIMDFFHMFNKRLHLKMLWFFQVVCFFSCEQFKWDNHLFLVNTQISSVFMIFSEVVF